MARLQQEREDLLARMPYGRRLSRAHSGGSLGSPLRGSSGNLAQQQQQEAPKWQVQNRVGSGALYNIADGSLGGEQLQQQAPGSPYGPRHSNGSLGGGAAAAGPGRDKVAGVDLQYLRNVLLKFLEAVAAGRTAERDALLPAIAALVQASPAEFHVMKRVLANTAPATTQVLSALGIRF
jgi:hypothetical protein